MKRFLISLWRDEAGVLSFEWTILLTLLTIGIVTGLSAARDATVDELGDVAEAAGAMDQSYSLAAISIPGIFTSNASTFTDDAMIFTDCARQTAANGGFVGQGASTDAEGGGEVTTP